MRRPRFAHEECIPAGDRVSTNNRVSIDGRAARIISVANEGGKELAKRYTSSRDIRNQWRQCLNVLGIYWALVDTSLPTQELLHRRRQLVVRGVHIGKRCIPTTVGRACGTM